MSSEFNLLEYLYYRATILYGKIEKKSGEGDNKNTGAVLVAVCVYLNLLAILLFSLVIVLGDTFTQLSKYSLFKFSLGGLYVIILLFSLFILAKKSHERIFKKYEEETLSQREKRGFFVMAYVFFSFVILAVSVFISKNIL
ncbi:MAG: hypothetical protein HRT73_07490 [Flavobacteriales bacterium]|nr:hypothetical protein [Flavobacteriales bacterium]